MPGSAPSSADDVSTPAIATDGNGGSRQCSVQSESIAGSNNASTTGQCRIATSDNPMPRIKLDVMPSALIAVPAMLNPITKPIQGVAPEVVPPSRLGNTRHLSAAQFVQDQRDAIALVASVDGRFTVFAWSPCEEMVHAHRVESLLL